MKEKDNLDNFDAEKKSENEPVEEKKTNSYDGYLQQLTEQETASKASHKENTSSDKENIEKEFTDIKSNSGKSFKDFIEKLKAMPKKKKIIISVVSIIILILIILFSIIASYFNLIDWNSGDDYKAPTGDDYIQQDDMNFDPMSTVTDATGLQDYLEKWHNNGGDLMQSKNVINVLLMGLDEAKIHSDSMILISINKVTKEIIMTSFFRDTYTCLLYTSPSPRD